MPDLALDYHRIKVPLDHPDRSVTRTKLEYPTVDVTFTYLDAINKLAGAPSPDWDLIGARTTDSFTDKAIEGIISDLAMILGLRGDAEWRNRYSIAIDASYATKDFWIHKVVNKTMTTLGYEAVDLPSSSSHLCKFSAKGSTLKGYRTILNTPKITVTDTTFPSGYVLVGAGWSVNVAFTLAYFLRAPSSPSTPALAILEVETTGSGSSTDPFRPSMISNLVEITSLSGLQEFLYLEARKYEILRNKGFTDEEIKLVLGYIPQHQVDLNSVTWGAFEFSEKSPTNIITIQGDNLYRPGAVERQVEYARNKGLKTLKPPRDYREAKEQYNNLKKDFSHWLAGKDNYAYQALGWEVLDLFQNVDFYYGELLEHKIHYNQLKQVPEWEITNRLITLYNELSKVTILVDERNNHLKKLSELLKKGW